MKPRLLPSAAATLLALAAAVSGSSCASPPVEPDRTEFLAHMPRSVLVLPPLDETPEADAPYAWLATITRPLAERGYYVFPVAIVDAMMKENGLPTPGEMHQVSLQKLGEVFGADAVLYVNIKDWGTSYHILDSESKVSVDARLVDVKSGAVLWVGSSSALYSSSQNNQGGLGGLLFGALAGQIVASASDPTPGLARQANWTLVHSPEGLLLGPRHPGFEEDQKKHGAGAPAPAK